MKPFLFLCLSLSCLAPQKGATQSIKFEGFDFGYSSFRQTFDAIDYGEFYTSSRHTNTLLDTGIYVNTNGQQTIPLVGLHFRFNWRIGNYGPDQVERHRVRLSFRNGFADNPILRLTPNNADTPANHTSYQMTLRETAFGIGVSYDYTFLSTKYLKMQAGATFCTDMSISRKMVLAPDSIVADTTENGFSHSYFLDQNPSFGIHPYIMAEIPLRKSTSLYCRFHYGYTRYNLEGIKQHLTNSGWQLGIKFNM